MRCCVIGWVSECQGRLTGTVILAWLAVGAMHPEVGWVSRGTVGRQRLPGGPTVLDTFLTSSRHTPIPPDRRAVGLFEPIIRITGSAARALTVIEAD